MKNVNISETVTARAILIKFLTHRVQEGYYPATRNISIFTTFGSQKYYFFILHLFLYKTCISHCTLIPGKSIWGRQQAAGLGLFFFFFFEIFICPYKNKCYLRLRDLGLIPSGLIPRINNVNTQSLHY